MARFLIVANYSPDGLKGVIAKGGTARQDAVAKMVAELGGSLESFYFAFGESDAYVTVEMPDNISAAAVGMAVGSSGLASCKTIVLLTPEEIDRATQTGVHYQAPGQ